MHLKCWIVVAIISAFRSNASFYILGSGNWVAQIESRKEENINGAKPREENEEKERRREEARGEGKEKKERETKKLKGRKRALHWIVWHSRNPPVLVTTLLTLCTLLYCIFKARATCISVYPVCIRYFRKIYTLSCVPTQDKKVVTLNPDPGGRLPAKSSLWKEPYLQSSYMCTRGRSCSLFYLLFVRNRCVPELPVPFEDHVNRVTRELFFEERKNSTWDVLISDLDILFCKFRDNPISNINFFIIKTEERHVGSSSSQDAWPRFGHQEFY